MSTILILLVFNLTGRPIYGHPIFFDGIKEASISNFLFISTPYGIYTFDQNAETWGNINSSSGIPDNKIKVIGYDEGILWVATENGIASADIKINDWRTYDTLSKIKTMGFDEEYVWLGSDSGLQKFNKYKEEIEPVLRLKINDMLMQDNYIWLATPDGILKYNLKFEKTEEIPLSSKDNYTFIINTPSKTWFISDKSFVSYTKELEKWSNYNSFQILDYDNINDSIFALTNKNKIYLYDPHSDNWSEFRDIEIYDKINGICIGGGKLLLATNKGLVVYDIIKKQKTFYNHMNGLLTDSIIDCYQKNKFIFAVTSHSIEFLNIDKQEWQVKELIPPRKARKKLFYIDEAGGHLKLIKSLDTKLQGMAYYTTGSSSQDTSIDMQVITQDKNNRSLSLYYNNSDNSQIVYGLGYRGTNRDLIYKTDLGFLKTEYNEFDLLPQFSTYGGSIKTRVCMDIQAGQIKSSFRNDFFTGSSIQKKLILNDNFYLKNTFYSIDTILLSTTQSYDTIFIDDHNSFSDSPKTRKIFTIGGITGDFDPLINNIDYFIDYKRGIIHFKSAKNTTDNIVILLGTKEIIIQSDSIKNHMMENVYSLGPNIIPNSLTLEITDTTGNKHSLYSFGIDRNNDNKIDPEFINLDLGFLIFPQKRPFPDETYTNGVHTYSMSINFSSNSNCYYLSYKPIVIGSEHIYVDNETQTRGIDYIVDYTEGRLLFLKEGIISDFSKIQVQYSSVEREKEDMFYSVQPSINFGNNSEITTAVMSFENENILSLSGLIQSKTGEEKRIKVIPQVAVNNNRDYACSYDMIAAYNMLGINANYTTYSRDFNDFGKAERLYGKLKESYSIAGNIEPINFLHLDVDAKKESQMDSLENTSISENMSGKLSYANPAMPQTYISLSKGNFPDINELLLKAGSNYEFEKFRSKVKLNTTLNNGIIELNADSEKTFNEYMVNTTISFPFKINNDLLLKFNNYYTNGKNDKNGNEIRTAFNIDLIPGIYYTGNYNNERLNYMFIETKDISWTQNFYNNLNIAPGIWYSPLSIFNCSFNSGKSLLEYTENTPADYNIPLLTLSPVSGLQISRITEVNSYSIIPQFTPTVELLLWGNHTVNTSGLSYYSLPNLKISTTDELRVEWNTKKIGLLILSGRKDIIKTYPLNETYVFYSEWNHPWNPIYRTKLTLNYNISENKYNESLILPYSEIKLNYDNVLRFGINYFNIYLGGLKESSYNASVSSYALTPGCGTNLTLFKFLLMRFNYETTFRTNTTSTQNWSFKVTGQF
ncbi:MAG: hypothetical protein PHE49_03780 [bacterium]|nr:hypothetical protein [bacterium]